MITPIVTSEINTDLKNKNDIDHLALLLSRWGLGDVARVLLDGLRPLAFIGGQLLWLLQPATSILIKPGQLARYARLLEDPEAMDSLIERLEKS